MIEFDFGFDAKPAQVRPQLAVAVALGDPHRLEHLDVAPRRRQRDNAGLIDRRNERRGAAVHDRNFRAVDFDDGVIDAKAVQRGKHMFGGRDGRAVMVAEHGGEFGRRHRAVMGAQFAVGLAVDSAAQKYDAGIGFGRMQCKGGGRAGMNADAGDGHMILQRRLPAGGYAPHHAFVPHLTAKLRERITSRTDGHPNVRGTQFASTKGTGRHRPPDTRSPNTSPLTRQTLPAQRHRPTHAFLPTVTFFRPHSCRLLAAKSDGRADAASPNAQSAPSRRSAAGRIELG